MSSVTMRYLSLFSGIGGFDLGFDRAGLTCAGQVEINEYCQRVLEKHWPDVKRIADVKKVKGNEFGAIDIICGGFPCQPHSLAGKRRGAKDERNLWPEYRRLVATIRPTWVVGENVPGIRTTILDDVLSDLESLNYAATTISIPACAFDAPHRRERYFILAYADKQRLERRNSKISEERSNKRASGEGSSFLAYTQRECAIGRRDGTERGEWGAKNTGEDCGPRDGIKDVRWQPEPGVGRVADGIPHRVDRLRALGNAVVPMAAEWLGKLIITASNGATL